MHHLTRIVLASSIGLVIGGLCPACTTTAEGTGPTGATCPATSQPTYAGFGQPFFAAFCTPCHSASSRDRHGAPPGLDFDSEAEIARSARDIDADAASGPHARNVDMPDMSGPVHLAPTEAQREMLGAFLACEQARR